MQQHVQHDIAISIRVADQDLDREWLRSKLCASVAHRMRGEIFLAERWLIVEGQADYLIVHAVAHALGYDLDQHGVSVIDAQNNGNPTVFAALARALGIPWLAVFDGDDAGLRYMESIRKRGFSDTEVEMHCRTHRAGDLEAQLIADGLEPQLREILASLDARQTHGRGRTAHGRGHNTHELKGADLSDRLRKNKTAYAAELAACIRSDDDSARCAPTAFSDAVEQLRGLK